MCIKFIAYSGLDTKLALCLKRTKSATNAPYMYLHHSAG